VNVNPTRERRCLFLLFICVVGLNAPVVDTFIFGDDIDHLVAARSGAELTGRDGWLNYIPLPGLLWMGASRFGLETGVLLLRVVSILIQGLTVYALYRSVQLGGGKPQWAFTGCLLYILHPLGFAARNSLNCMHYLLAMMFMWLALLAMLQWSRKREKRFLWQASLFELCCLFSSVHGIVVVPALFLSWLVFACKDARPLAALNRLRSAPWFFLLVPVAIWAAIFFSRDLTLSGHRSTSLGQALVEYFNILFALTLWHPEWWWPLYGLLLSVRDGGPPLFAYAVCSGVTFLAVVAGWFWRRSRPLGTLAVWMLVLSIALPPRPYFTPRYAFFGTPWVALLQAAFIGFVARRLADYIPQRTAPLIPALLVAALIATSLPWHAKYVRDHRVATRVTRELVRAVTRAPGARHLALVNVPAWVGADEPWPRPTVGFGELQDLLALADARPAILTVPYSKSPASRETWTLSTSTNSPSPPTQTLVWNGTTYQERPPAR